MSVIVSRWGNSLGIRIPKDVIGRAGLHEGDEVDIVTDDQKIIITRTAPRYRLENLLAGSEGLDWSEAFDWGEDQGRERLDD